MIEQVFARQGLFHRELPGFIPRPAQLEMARAVYAALNNGGKLVVESGTGTGKTFAYLVPALLSAKKIIISTATRHLQDQIYNRDLPQVMNLLGLNSKIQILKGRANYLCRYRYEQSREQVDWVSRKERSALALISDWAVKTRNGDIAEVAAVPEQSAIWKKVTATTDTCLGGICPAFSRCHVNAARKKASESEIVVVNHHLFFSDLTMKPDGFGTLLPGHEAVIFDEAHSLAEIASQFFGFSVSSAQIAELADDIAAAEKLEQSGVSLPLAELVAASDGVQQLLAKRAPTQGGSFNDTRDNLTGRDFDRALDKLKAAVTELGKKMAQAAPAGDALNRGYERSAILEERLFDWSEDHGVSDVRWLAATAKMFRLHQTPLDISHNMAGFMERPGMAWIFTSATLAVGDDFSAFNRRLGLQEPDTAQWRSPYDYANHSLLYLPAQLPEPNRAEYPPALAQVILEVTALSRGRAFCLFTSYRMMEQVWERVRDAIAWPLLLQGEASKQHLIEQFIAQDNAVLFGTASFWEGVDIKGDALSCVFIDKLPFASPADPVLKTRLENCAEQDGNPFMDIQIPDAVIALKQGVGRLIRSEEDCGVMVLCDSRLTAKHYGRIFLDSLPAMPITHELDSVARFFAEHNTRDSNA